MGLGDSNLYTRREMIALSMRELFAVLLTPKMLAALFTSAEGLRSARDHGWFDLEMARRDLVTPDAKRRRNVLATHGMRRMAAFEAARATLAVAEQSLNEMRVHGQSAVARYLDCLNERGRLQCVYSDPQFPRIAYNSNRFVRDIFTLHPVMQSRYFDVALSPVLDGTITLTEDHLRTEALVSLTVEKRFSGKSVVKSRYDLQVDLGEVKKRALQRGLPGSNIWQSILENIEESRDRLWLGNCAKVVHMAELVHPAALSYEMFFTRSLRTFAASHSDDHPVAALNAWMRDRIEDVDRVSGSDPQAPGIYILRDHAARDIASKIHRGCRPGWAN